MIAVLLLLLPAQIDVLDSKDFGKDLQVSAVTATVRVLDPRRNQQGSGVILQQKGPFVWVLTAAHLVDGAEAIEVAFFPAKGFPKPEPVTRQVEVLASSKDADLALLRVTVRAPVPAGLRLCPGAMAPGGMKFPALSAGCGQGEPPSCKIETVTTPKKVRRPNSEAPVQVWEVAQEPATGRSGGALLDRQGRVIGICSGRNNGKGYFTHLDEIHRFLKRHRFDWLAPEKEQR